MSIILSNHVEEILSKVEGVLNVTNAELAFPVIQNVYETQRDKFKRIVVPFTDGVKSLQVVTDLEKAYQTNGIKVILLLKMFMQLEMMEVTCSNNYGQNQFP